MLTEESSEDNELLGKNVNVQITFIESVSEGERDIAIMLGQPYQSTLLFVNY